MLPSSASAPEAAARKSTENQLNRACEACRLSKVRCLANPIPGSSQCQRCAKAGRQCIFAPPAKRRQRKRTDVRVAELEREVQQLHSLLKPNAAANISPAGTSERESMDDDEEEEAESPDRESPELAQSQEGTGSPTANGQPGQWAVVPPKDAEPPREDLLRVENDILDRGIITIQQAEELLNTYRNDLVHDFPGVVIPKDWTVEQLRSRKPALFHAVMAAASNSKGATLSNRLHEEVKYLYARSMIIQAEKSMQYIQALFITVAYNNPPNSPAQLQVYMFCNMAASMALELGLASKPRTHEQLPKRAIRSLQRISSAEELLENCRTILALYTLTAGFSMRLRRPNILLFNSWMEECQVLLQKSRILEDRRILACLRLQRIADEAYTAFGLDDASTSFTLSELRLQATLRIFDRRMQDWMNSIPAEVMTFAMTIEYYMNIMSMWEFAMDGGRYDAPDFRNRHLTLPALDDCSVQPESLSRTALQINATITCISAAHSVLDTFLQIPIPSLQHSPSVIFVRAVYALITLCKADYAVGTDADGMGAVLDSKSLKVDAYMDEVLSRIGQAVGEQGCRIPSHWLFIVRAKLKAWHEEHMQWRRDGGHLRRGKARKEAATEWEQDATRITANASARRDTPLSDPTTVLPTRSSRPQTTTNAQRQPPPSQPQQPSLSNLHGVQQQPLPLFNLSTDYTWPTPTPNDPIPRPNNLPTSSCPAFPVHDPASFDQDMTDFSTAFQNGDLYLWNDMGENYGGWIPNPQGDSALYDAMQFGGGRAM